MFGLGQMHDPFSHFGDGFMHMPSFDESFGNMERSMHNMDEMMKQNMKSGHGDVHSESFSSSSSSRMGEDGKMHTKEQKQGEEKECHDGKCFVKKCANGVCKEFEQNAQSE